MYIRTTSRKNGDGTEVRYYQLAHNFRDPATGRVQAKVIHNFGRADELDRGQLVRLCHSIARVCGLEVRDPLEQPVITPEKGILPDGVTMGLTRQVGVCLVVAGLWRRLGIEETLRKLTKSKRKDPRFEMALLAMTTNRLCDPQSKLGVWERWLQTVYLPGGEMLTLTNFYESMDFLYRHAPEIEKAIFFKTANLLNLEVDIIFYDTTTCSFTIDEEDDEVDGDGLRRWSRSKEGAWAPLIKIALAVTREGLPVRSWVFPGDTSDVVTVETVKADLRGWQLGRALFVADAGMNSDKNRQDLAASCGTYLLASRISGIPEIEEQVIGSHPNFQEITDNLHAQEVLVETGEAQRRYVLCYNPKEAIRQALHRQQVLQELEQELAKHKSRDATAKWAIRLLASGRFGKYLEITKEKTVAINQDAIRKAERLDGKWVLITNDKTISVQDAANGYKSLLVIERLFRSLKTVQIKVHPVHHWLSYRIVAHVKICVLALLLQRYAELTLQQPWRRIQETLATLQVTEFKTSSHSFLQRNEVPPKVATILKKLDISVPPQVLDVQSLPSL